VNSANTADISRLLRPISALAHRRIIELAENSSTDKKQARKDKAECYFSVIVRDGSNIVSSTDIKLKLA